MKLQLYYDMELGALGVLKIELGLLGAYTRILKHPRRCATAEPRYVPGYACCTRPLTTVKYISLTHEARLHECSEVLVTTGKAVKCKYAY